MVRQIAMLPALLVARRANPSHRTLAFQRSITWMSRALTMLTMLGLFSAVASAESLKPVVKKLLEQGNKSTPSAVTAAREQFEALKRKAPRDPRVQYAFAVVLVRQRHYAEALPLIDQFLASKQKSPGSNRAFLAALELKIWTLVQSRGDKQALKSAVQLSERLADTAQPTTDDEATHAATFLGTVFGFLEEVRSITSPERDAGRAKVLENLGAKQQVAFEAGYQSVVDTIARFEDERQAKAKMTAAAAEQERAKAEEELEADKEAIDVDKAAIRSEGERLSTLWTQYNAVKAQVTAGEATQKRLTSDLNAVQQRLLRYKDSDTSTSDLRHRAELNLQGNALLTQLSAINAQLATQRASAIALNAQIQHISDENAAAISATKKATKRAAAAEKRIADGARQNVSPSGPTGKAALFSSYAPFDTAQQEFVLSLFQ